MRHNSPGSDTLQPADTVMRAGARVRCMAPYRAKSHSKSPLWPPWWSWPQRVPLGHMRDYNTLQSAQPRRTLPAWCCC